MRFKKTRGIPHWWEYQMTPNVQICLWRCRRNANDQKIYYIAFARRKPPAPHLGPPPKLGDDFEYDIAGGLKRTPQEALDVTYEKLVVKFQHLGALLGYAVEK